MKKARQKHNTICVRHHYAQTNTNNVKKTWALIQTTRGNDEPNIMFMQKSWGTSQHGTPNVKTHNRKTQKSKNMSIILLNCTSQRSDKRVANLASGNNLASWLIWFYKKSMWFTCSLSHSQYDNNLVK